MRYILVLILFCFIHGQAQNKNIPRQDIQHEVWSITEVMMHDVVNPPAAARFYAYSLLAGYEVLCRLDTTLNRFQYKFKNYPIEGNDQKFIKINPRLAALYAILETGRNLIPSGYLLEQNESELVGAYSGYSKSVIDSSLSFARHVAGLITQYAKNDGYFRLSTLSRYKPLQDEAHWQPTPPEYMPPVEPNWKTIRTFFMDSASQCMPLSCVPFSKDTTSDFYKMAKEVYNAGNQLSNEQKWIANFWDCNPFAVQYQGHMSIGLKKISPGAHWLCITGLACQKAELSFSNTMFLHTLVALTLHDAFISCWDEKYRLSRIRPETVINRYIDEKWKPLLQTPPFPEYPSGHSVISTASAEVLTYFLGDHFAYSDSTEQYIGIPARRFASFRAAAAEARISRLYGGIHFRDAIENGAEEGRSISSIVLKKVAVKPLLIAKLH